MVARMFEFMLSDTLADAQVSPKRMVKDRVYLESVR